MGVLALAGNDVLDQVVDAFLGDNAGLQHEAIDQGGTEALEDLALHRLVGIEAVGLELKVKPTLDLGHII